MQVLKQWWQPWSKGPAGPLILFLLLALLFLFPVTLGGKALLPTDDLYLTPPWSAHAAEQGVGTPHNPLIADMILQNYSWKSFIRESYRHGELPLWNPYIFAGMPFLAAGQYGALYPPGMLFVVLPVALAYGWFTALHLFLAGAFGYAFLRTLGTSRAAATFGGVAFMFSGFLVVSFLWPMVLSSAVWLPFLLLCVERAVARWEAATPLKTERSEPATPERTPPLSPRGLAPHFFQQRPQAAASGEPRPALNVQPSLLIWPLIGAVGLALHLLAGHLEISFYVLFTVLAYSLFRLYSVGKDLGRGTALHACGGLAAMALLGLGLAGVQLIPFLELIRENFRAGQVSAKEVLGWALPLRQFVAFVMPDFFGNPSHHGYLDLLTWTVQPITGAQDQFGEARNYPFWGIKNYVEGTAYVGVLPLLLALAALLRRWSRTTAFFALYGVFCLLLAFGTPLYRLLFFAVPGFDQVHSPFRWAFPWAFSTIVLAAFGFDLVFGTAKEQSAAQQGFWTALRARRTSILGGVAVTVGGTLLAAVVLSRVFVDRSLALAATLRDQSTALQAAFATPQMLYSYQMWPAAVLGLLLLGGGAILLYSQQPRVLRWAPALAVGLLVLDLFQFGAGFNTASDPSLPAFVPPSLRQLQQDPELFRIATFGDGQVLRPNSAMLAGLQDIRGYDTVIPRQYVDYWRVMEEPSGLLFSQINRLADPRSLTSPLLNLLNVKYVLSADELKVNGYTPVYQGEVNVYRNEGALPRAFAVFGAVRLEGKGRIGTALGSPAFDPQRLVLLEGAGGTGGLPAPAQRPMVPAEVVSYRPNQVVVSVTMPEEGYLVLADQYFAGWRARDTLGTDLRVERADGMLRAVRLTEGEHTVTFRYAPDSFRLGLLVSVLAAAALVLGGGIAAWGVASSRAGELTTVGRVLKNSVTPMAAQLLSRLVDFAFAIFMLRLLGPAEYGNYAFAVVLIGYFAILSDFGLGTLLTREVARNRNDAARYLSNVAAVRVGLSLASVPALAAVLWVYAHFFGLSGTAVTATLIFLVSLLPSAVASTISALFSAHERMEYPALVMVLTTLVRATAGIVVLLLGWGVVGLAVASVIASAATAVIFLVLLVRRFSWPVLHFDPPFARMLLSASFPLMINQFLNTIFFRVDVLFLQPLHGAGAVGYYSTAYKFVDGLLLVPSLFTLALFPVLSRHAAVSAETLLRTHTRAVKLLLIVALPISAGMTLIADQLILTFFGPDYAPSALALQVLIWFLPFSYVNGVTQYVLIAAGRQRFITVAFFIGTSFNILGNLLLIPRYSYLGAGVTTVLSEVVLLAPFLWEIRRSVGPLPLGRLLLRPSVAALIMVVVLLPVRTWNMFLLAPLGLIIYAGALLLLGVLDDEDRKLVAALRPSRSR